MPSEEQTRDLCHHYREIYAQARAIEADLLAIARRMLLAALARRRV